MHQLILTEIYNICVCMYVFFIYLTKHFPEFNFVGLLVLGSQGEPAHPAVQQQRPLEEAVIWGNVRLFGDNEKKSFSAEHQLDKRNQTDNWDLSTARCCK